MRSTDLVEEAENWQPSADGAEMARDDLYDDMWKQDRIIWDPSAADLATSQAYGVRLSHMRLPPGRFSELDVMPKVDECSVEGKGVLKVPPDGNCILHAWMAAQSPEWWRKVPRHPSGHIKDVAAERLIADQAREHLGMICSLARAAGDHEVAQWLEDKKMPGDREFKYYAEYFECSFLILPVDQPLAVPWIHGKNRVGFAVEHFINSSDGNRTGHFELVHSWIGTTKCCIDGLEDILHQLTRLK